MASANTKRAGAKAKKVQQRNPGFQGWNTTDAEEIERRRWRGQTDIAAVEALEAEHAYFGTFHVRSTGGAGYDVEIRSLGARENSCACPDWRVNGLGTCKHVEGVLDRLRRKGKRAFEAAGRWGNPRLEVFPAIDGACRVLVRPPAGRKDVETALAPLLDADGAVTGDPLDAVATLRQALVATTAWPRGNSSWPASPPVPRRSTCCAPNCCPTRSKACCIWRSANGFCWPTKWAWARPSRPSPRWRCCAACGVSNAFWWCCPPP